MSLFGHGFSSGANTTGGITEGQPSADGLVYALWSTFSLIVFGYFAARFKWLPPPDLGLGQFIGRVALPALVFLAIAELQVEGINWRLVGAIAMGKTIIFLLVAVVTYISNRHSPDGLAMAGIRGVFVTQSNDFALGLPLIESVYGKLAMTRYLYVAAPISFLWLNLIAFTMMEISNRRKMQLDIALEGGKDERSLALVVCVGVLSNPIIFMTFLGVIFNASMHGELPIEIQNPSRTLSDAFSAGALVMLGMSMHGRIFYLRGPRLLVAIVLVLCKTVMLPIVTKSVFGIMEPRNDVEGNFAFIYSTFPSAPGVLAFAFQYDIEPVQVAAMLVLCTVMSAPIMFIMGRAALLPDEEDAVYDSATSIGETMGSVSSGACAMAMILLIANRRLKYTLDRSVFAVLFATMINALGGAACSFKDLGPLGLRIRHGISYFGWFASICAIGVYAITVHELGFGGSASSRKIRKVFPILPWIIALVCTLVVCLAVESERMQEQCFFREESSLTFGFIVSKIVLPLISLAVVVYVAVRRAMGGKIWGLLQDDVESDPYEDECGEDALLLNPELEPPTVYDTSSIQHDKVCESKMEATEFRHSVYLIVEALSLVLCVGDGFLSFGASCPYEIDWVDTCVNSSKGLILFFCFATDERLWNPISNAVNKLLNPIVKPIRKIIFKTEESDLQRCREWLMSVDCPESREECIRCIPLLVRDRRSLEKTLKYGLRRYKNVFTGTQFVDWMLDQELADTRAHAELVGRTLLSHGCFEHVKNEHHFWDSGYFYKFNDLQSVMRRLQSSTLPDHNQVIHLDSPASRRRVVKHSNP